MSWHRSVDVLLIVQGQDMFASFLAETIGWARDNGCLEESLEGTIREADWRAAVQIMGEKTTVGRYYARTRVWILLYA